MKLTRFMFIGIFSMVWNLGIATVFHVNPSTGSDTGDGTLSMPYLTLENVVNAGLIQSQAYVLPYNASNPQKVIKNANAPIKSGDTIMLYDGLHGELFLQNYINADFVTIIAASNHTPIIKKIHIQSGSKWRIEGISVSSEPYNVYLDDKLVYLQSHEWQGPVDHIIIKDCQIYSTTSPWTEANEWVTKASDGVYIRADSVLVANNQVTNVVMGITMLGDYIEVIGNNVENFSGDGMRILGSHNLVEANTIKNCYKVDDNHDDGIQSFTTGGIVVDSNIVRRNKIFNYEDPNQPLLGDLQGIGCFDGPFNDWVVENNLVVVNHWHGISIYGAKRCKIINNTVLDPSPSSSPGPSWILIDDDNAIQSEDCVVKNNAVNSLTINSNSNTDQSNNTIFSSIAHYNVNFVNYTSYDYSLKGNSSLIDVADPIFAPSVDIDGNSRPFGGLPDIGAYEYSSIMPIELTRFDVFLNKNKQVYIEWETTYEKDNAFFEVQRSKNGQVFETLARVKSKGDSFGVSDYYWIDENPLSGRCYYRLQQVDNNGAFQYSDIRSLAIPGRNKAVLYPTVLHVHERIFIESPDEEIVLKLYDINGSLLMNKSVKTNTFIPLDSVSSGLYHYVLINSETKQQGKILVL